MLRMLYLIGLALLVSGCVHSPGVTPPPSLQAHTALLENIQHWQITGKLGVRSTDDSGTASLKWRQSPESFFIYLSGPLGQKRMEIEGTPKQVELRQNGQMPIKAKTAETLIKKASGWTLPVSQLNYWVRGIPAPTARITRLEQNDQGLISLLQQESWTLSYSNYRDQMLNGQTLALPGKIIAEHRDIRLTLIIRDWQLGSAP
jgi:outer membrane lipoprotein LolB